jgi:hypothetical protein
VSGPLTKVAEIELLGQRFDLAKNGRFTLCREEWDAYGRPIATEVPLTVDSLRGGRAASEMDVLQALLDALGDATQRLQSHRDARLGAGREGE